MRDFLLFPPPCQDNQGRYHAYSFSATKFPPFFLNFFPPTRYAIPFYKAVNSGMQAYHILFNSFLLFSRILSPRVLFISGFSFSSSRCIHFFFIHVCVRSHIFSSLFYSSPVPRAKWSIHGRSSRQAFSSPLHI